MMPSRSASIHTHPRSSSPQIASPISTLNPVALPSGSFISKGAKVGAIPQRSASCAPAAAARPAAMAAAIRVGVFLMGFLVAARRPASLVRSLPRDASQGPTPSVWSRICFHTATSS